MCYILRNTVTIATVHERIPTGFQLMVVLLLLWYCSLFFSGHHDRNLAC